MVLSRKGQSTIEYLLLFTGFIAVCIVLLIGSNSAYQGRLNDTYTAASGSLETASNAFYNSF